MDIIPQVSRFVQVGISEIADQNTIKPQLNQILSIGLSEIQYQAQYLYKLGLNVFPQPIAQKGGYPWMRLQYSRLNQDDKNFGLNVLFAGECNLAIMCGASSGNLFVLDCETWGAFQNQVEIIRKRGIPLWAATTARGGHIYLRAKEGEVQNIATGVIPNMEIRGRGGYVLAPPSLHPNGAKYTWCAQEGDEPPTISINEISWLISHDKQKIQLEVKENPVSNRGAWSMQTISPASNLSKTSRDYLEQGATITEGNRNNRLFRAACDLAGNHYSHSEAEHILTPIAAKSGLPIYEIKATIASAFSQNRTASRPNQTQIKENPDWRYVLLWASNQEWKNSCDRALFLALIERARIASNENGQYRASIRELSELARISTTTVQRALLRLENANLVLSVGYDRTSKASLWQFNENLIKDGKQLELNLNTVKIPPHWLRYSESLFQSDLCERGALGLGVNFVYQFFRTLEEPTMPSEIAESLGISVHQVNYAIRKLHGLGLICRYPQGWYSVEMSLPELEAKFIDVQGKGLDRAEKYRREREIFAGKILYAARLRREGDKFFEPVKRYTRQFEALDILDDSLIQLGLELGGVLWLGDGIRLSKEGFVQ